MNLCSNSNILCWPVNGSFFIINQIFVEFRVAGGIFISLNSSSQKVWFPVSRSSESSNCNWSASEKPVSSSQSSSRRRTLRQMHVKKPLNAFMLFMKEMRPKVIDECTLKESAAINQILGRKVRACKLD